MSDLTLVIGSKKKSSWSLRPWIALKQAGLPFTEKEIALDQPDTAANILKESPSGRVPALRHGGLTIWDSLAICEYVAELACAHPLWPENRDARGIARAVSAEMHSGFIALRKHLPMMAGELFPGFIVPTEAQADIARVQAIWSQCRTDYGQGGSYLFGAWSIADAMYAPVVLRFQSYGVNLQPDCRRYLEACLALPSLQQWVQESL